MGRRHKSVVYAFAVLVALVSALPTAEAGLLPKFQFDISVKALRFDPNQTGESGLDFTLLTGAFESRGERAGAYGFLRAHEGRVFNVTQIDVYNLTDQQAALARAATGQCSGQECAIERRFINGELGLDRGTTFVLFGRDVEVNHTETAPIGVASIIEPPESLRASFLPNLQLETSLALVADSVHAQGHVPNQTSEVYGWMPLRNGTVKVTDALGTASYAGEGYAFRFHGTPQYDVRAVGALVPFAGDTRAVFFPGTGEALRDHFQPEILNEFLPILGVKGDIVPPSVADGLREFGPILNGVFLGPFAGSVVNDEEQAPEALGMVRFGAVELRPTPDGGRMVGESDFLLLGAAGFYTTQTGSRFGPLRVPAFAAILWLLAAGSIVASFLLRPVLAGPQLSGFGAIRLLGWAVHGLALVLAFILWDLEIRGFLGTSLITLFNAGAFGQGRVLLVTAFFELATFSIATLLFGMPIRFLVNSGLKLGGLKKARGIGKGVGNLAVWGLGAPFIPFILNGFVAGIIDALSKALPG